MPVGYLVTVALAAVGTWLTLAPAHRPRLLAMLSFRLGILFGEMPVVVICWLLLATGLAFGQGDVDAWPARAAVGLAAVTAGGLVAIAGRGLRTGAAVRAALQRDLGQGPGRHGPVDGATGAAASGRVAGPPRRASLAHLLLAPVYRGRRDVVRVAGLSYGPAGRRNLLDVYHRRDRPTGGPVLIHMHGGGYHGGRKNLQALPLINRLASRGWVCVSANYRLRPAVAHPEHLIDLKRVIAWAREHAAQHGADPHSIVVAGSSAGGHLATLAALTQNDPAFQPGFEAADTSVTAAISLNGYYGNYYGQDASSAPLSRLTAAAPPMFLAHGDHDTVVPVAAARAFAAAARSTSTQPVVYAELPGAQHAFDLFHSPRFEAVIGGIECFIAQVTPDLHHLPGTRSNSYFDLKNPRRVSVGLIAVGGRDDGLDPLG
jgi:acetyl esterase/lipase